MNFRVGQKVVCLEPTHDLVKGGVYIVSRVEVVLGILMVDVAEFADQFDPKFPAFFARRFRPAVERKTDISIFTDMLKRVEVDA